MRTIKDAVLTLALVLAGAALVAMAGVVVRAVAILFLFGWGAL